MIIMAKCKPGPRMSAEEMRRQRLREAAARLSDEERAKRIKDMGITADEEKKWRKKLKKRKK